MNQDPGWKSGAVSVCQLGNGWMGLKVCSEQTRCGGVALGHIPARRRSVGTTQGCSHGSEAVRSVADAPEGPAPVGARDPKWTLSARDCEGPGKRGTLAGAQLSAAPEKAVAAASEPKVPASNPG